MEDVRANPFNPGLCYQPGGDTVRVGGIQYTVDPDKTYKVAGWAPVAEGVQGVPVLDVVAECLGDKKVIKGVKLNQPKVVGLPKGNRGIVLYAGCQPGIERGREALFSSFPNC